MYIFLSWVFMTDLWYIKRYDFLRFETLKCPAIVLKFTKNFVLKFHYLLLGPLTEFVVNLLHISYFTVIKSLLKTALC